MKNTRQPRYARHRFLPEVICHAFWLYLRLPVSLYMVAEMLGARGIPVGSKTVRQ
jgi:putative transposase